MRQFPQTFRLKKHTSIHSAVKLLSLYVNGGERGADLVSSVSQAQARESGMQLFV